MLSLLGVVSLLLLLADECATDEARAAFTLISSVAWIDAEFVTVEAELTDTTVGLALRVDLVDLLWGILGEKLRDNKKMSTGNSRGRKESHLGLE